VKKKSPQFEIARKRSGESSQGWANRESRAKALAMQIGALARKRDMVDKLSPSRKTGGADLRNLYSFQLRNCAKRVQWRFQVLQTHEDGNDRRLGESAFIGRQQLEC